jgi:hypothetical protein
MVLQILSQLKIKFANIIKKNTIDLKYHLTSTCLASGDKPDVFTLNSSVSPACPKRALVHARKATHACSKECLKQIKWISLHGRKGR